MKVLFFINQFAGGGRERRMIQLVRGLDNNPEYVLHAIVFHKKIEYQEVLQTKLSVDYLEEPNRSKRCQKIETIISQVHPDIVHSWVDTPTEMVLIPYLKKKYGFKYIAGFIADGNTDAFFSLKHFAMLYTFRKADAIVSNSQAGLQAKRAPKNKSCVIYNGFDYSRLNFIIEKKLKKHSLGIATKYVALMSARINSAKDWSSYLSLAKRTINSNNDISFIAAGNGEMLEYYREKARTIPNILFLGRRSDIEEILAITDVCFLFTNNNLHAEGVSNSILEALASGVPVIATKGGGTAEIITDKYNGYLIDPGDVNSAFSLMDNLLNNEDERFRLSQNGIKSVKEKFTLKKMTADYINLYKQLSQK